MNASQGRGTNVVSIVMALAMVASTLATLPTFANGTMIESGNDGIMAAGENETISGNLTKNWLDVTNFVAGGPVVYLDQNNQLYLTIQNTGGDAGDDDYTANILQAKTDIQTLINGTNKHAAKMLLGKVVAELGSALASVSDNRRIESINNVLKAIAFLEAVDKMGIDTDTVIFNLADGVMAKVGTVINEATNNFGSEHPDVQSGNFFYEKALKKFESGKYAAAMALFKAAFEKALGAYECNAHLTVIDIIPKQPETIIDQPIIESIKAETADTVSVTWHPTQRGIHYVKLNMSGEYDVYASPGEMVESPPTILSVGFPVSPLGAEEYWDTPELRAIDPNDPVNNPGGYRNRTGPLTIFVQYGNLSIKNGGTLIFNDNVTLVIENTFPEWYTNKYSVNIESGGKFIINSPLRTTTIQSSSGAIFATYPFLNFGIVDFFGANVMYTYGPKDASNNPTGPGGIRNLPGSTCSLADCRLTDADTHTLTANNSEVEIYGDTLVGKGNEHTQTNWGTGIMISGNAAVGIDGISVEYNEGHGLECIDSDDVIILNGATFRNNNGDGIRLSNSNASVNGAVIVSNNGDGISIFNGAAPRVERSNITWNNGNGIRAESAAPIIKNNITTFQIPSLITP